MSSKLAFFNSGLTRAFFRSCGKTPVCMDSFTTEVNKFPIDGNTSFSIVVGIGSSSQFLPGD